MNGVDGVTDRISFADVGFQSHPEIWLLIAALVALGLYVTRVIGPKVVAGPAVTRRQRGWFLAGVVSLWLAADWPVHDVGERYLYSVHMVQHTLLTFVVPPMFLLATPTWLATKASTASLS